MELSLSRSPSLPALAWCAVISRGRESIQLHAGSQVEVTDNGIVEGAWSGPFEDFGFASAKTFTGTGLLLEEDKVILSTPTHTLYPIYSLQLGPSIFASNSLPFVLAVSDNYLDPKYPFYDSDIMSIIFGLDSYTKTIPTKMGAKIHLHYMANISIGKNLRVRSEQKRIRGNFSKFEDYFHFLVSETQAVVNNATDSRRCFSYKPITTVSSGYDSPACAVIAGLVGATTAITLKEARSDFAETEDSGKSIADVLRLEVTELSKTDYFKSGQESRELEFFASGYGGDDIVWLGAEDSLKGTLMFTGYHGDKIWDTKRSSVSTDIKRGDPSGSSLLEFRLRAGFLNFPLPFIAAQCHPDIQKIAVSNEMAEWTLGNKYDRPIPRRIVEKEGVPRNLFGQSKKAVALPYQYTHNGANPSLVSRMSEQSLVNFQQYINKQGVDVVHANSISLRVVNRIAKSHKINKVASILGLQKKLELLKWRHRKPISEHNYVTAWAANTLRNSYLAHRSTNVAPRE